MIMESIYDNITIDMNIEQYLDSLLPKFCGRVYIHISSKEFGSYPIEVGLVNDTFSGHRVKLDLTLDYYSIWLAKGTTHLEGLDALVKVVNKARELYSALEARKSEFENAYLEKYKRYIEEINREREELNARKAVDSSIDASEADIIIRSTKIKAKKNGPQQLVARLKGSEKVKNFYFDSQYGGVLIYRDCGYRISVKDLINVLTSDCATVTVSEYKL